MITVNLIKYAHKRTVSNLLGIYFWLIILTTWPIIQMFAIIHFLRITVILMILLLFDIHDSSAETNWFCLLDIQFVDDRSFDIVYTCFLFTIPYLMQHPKYGTSAICKYIVYSILYTFIYNIHVYIISVYLNNIMHFISSST